MYTAAALAAANPVLLKGEVVYESDTHRMKVGNGTTAWNDLPYGDGAGVKAFAMSMSDVGTNLSANRLAEVSDTDVVILTIEGSAKITMSRVHLDATDPKFAFVGYGFDTQNDYVGLYLEVGKTSGTVEMTPFPIGGGGQQTMIPVVGADSTADFFGKSTSLSDVLQKVIAATAIGKVRQVRYGGLQCMVWLLEGTTTVGVLGFAAEGSSLVYGAVDEGEFPAGIFDITDEEIAVTVLNTCAGIGLDAIPAANIGTDNSRQFVSAGEKATWNGKANSNLDNVNLTKYFAAKGYYKAPDGMMFAWGTQSQQTTAISVYYYPVGFLYTPYVVLTTPTNFGDAAVEVAAAIPTATTYFTMRPRYVKRLSNGQAEYGNSGCTFQYLAIGRWK